MPAVLAKRIAYTRAEYVSDLIVHLTGVVAVAAAVPVLVMLAILLDGTSAQVIATLVYGFGLVAMIGCSAVYNIFPHPEWEWLFRRLDHSAIYLKIAGTYTAFVLIAGHGFALAAGLWAVAAAGISLKMVSPARWRWIGLALYLGMGWVAAVLGHGVFAALPGPVVWLIATGGSLYTLGVVFYLWDRLPHHLTIWHVFVLAASLTIYSGVVIAVVV
ncbi:MAG: hemolysin III family protein [Silicimonas sp.]|nr:hemolysin III family protein [Silicimonas sp.]NND42928.1 Hly-III family protein [Silicimonas sp.]NNL74528.1 Hly-III family protein [Silicimonas sp.]RZW12540.1 MAG: Hly-III family protein [Paracoccaceae bacterium]